MSDGQERSEQATPQKRRKARQRGQVAQSRDLTATIVLGAALVGLVARHEQHARALHGAFSGAFEASALGLDVETAAAVAVAIAASVGRAFLPLLATIAIAGGIASFLQVGPVLSGEPLTPKLERLNPAEGLKRMFFNLRSWVELIRSLSKLLVVAAAIITLLVEHSSELLGLHSVPIPAAIAIVRAFAVDLVIRAVIAFAALAAIDLLYQRWQHGRDLRMTKDEVKREHKDQEGSPEQKAERKRAHEEVLAQADMARIREDADVVVVNPTHVACALTYDPADGTPRLIAKAHDHMALRIRRMAEEEGIPVRHDVSLARALYELEIDEAIPQELYEAVAITLHWVQEILQHRGDTPRWKSDGEGDGDATPTGLAR